MFSGLFTFIRRPRFFVSYSREDFEIVQPIVRILRATKVEIFFDDDRINPGADWERTIIDQLGRANGLFVFWTRNASQSRWVTREWKEALAQRKVVIPILIDDAPLPAELARYQGIRTSNAKLRADAVEQQVQRRVTRFNLGSAARYAVLVGLAVLGTSLFLQPTAEEKLGIAVSNALAEVRFAKEIDDTKMTYVPIIHTPLARTGIKYFLVSGSARLENLSLRDLRGGYAGSRKELSVTVQLRASYYEEHFRGNPGDINHTIEKPHEPSGLIDLVFKSGSKGFELKSRQTREFSAQGRAQEMMVQSGLPRVVARIEETANGELPETK